MNVSRSVLVENFSNTWFSRYTRSKRLFVCKLLVAAWLFQNCNSHEIPLGCSRRKAKCIKGFTIYRMPVALMLHACSCWQGFVIAFVSEFVPRLYYTLGRENDSLEGFVNATLSCFVVTEFEAGERPKDTDVDVLWDHFNNNSCGFNQPTCR